MLPRLILTGFLTIALATPLHAQNRRGAGGHQPSIFTEPADITGTVEAVQPPQIAVLGLNSHAWFVLIPPNAKVQVTGSAEVDCLKMGLMIEFKADIDDQGKIKEKVGELTIVSLSPEKQPGLFPPDEPAQEGGFGDFATPERGKPKPPKRTSGGMPAGTYRVVGKLMVRGGKLSVQTGRKLLPFETTEQPKIAVDFRDYSVATKGDKITVKGMAAPNPPNMAMQPGRAQAKEVHIELAEPLTDAKKKAKPEMKRPPKRSKKDADEGLPEQ
jgi:hypothetical protein